MRKFSCILLIVLALPSLAPAVKIADITRISGQRTNILTGLGLVYGLKGTGDGGDFQPAIRQLASMLRKFNNPSTVQELTSVANVRTLALVEVLFAQAISYFVFKQATTPREAFGMALIVGGVALLIGVQ